MFLKYSYLSLGFPHISLLVLHQNLSNNSHKLSLILINLQKHLNRRSHSLSIRDEVPIISPPRCNHLHRASVTRLNMIESVPQIEFQKRGSRRLGNSVIYIRRVLRAAERNRRFHQLS